uniref:GTP-binding protein enga, putative n=1 Tax=Arundo donax TaxID=35708 RepID=A0A0A9BYK6_ARUDO
MAEESHKVLPSPGLSLRILQLDHQNPTCALLQQPQSELHAHQVTQTCSLQLWYVSQMHAYEAIVQPQDPVAVDHPSHQSRKWQIETWPTHFLSCQLSERECSQMLLLSPVQLSQARGNEDLQAWQLLHGCHE